MDRAAEFEYHLSASNMKLTEEIINELLELHPEAEGPELVELAKDFIVRTPEIMDSSKTQTDLECSRKFYWQYIRHLVPKDRQMALSFGSAVHEALNIWYATYQPELALKAFTDAWEGDEVRDDLRTRERGIAILAAYFKKYEVEPFEWLALERSFNLPLEERDCPDCGMAFKYNTQIRRSEWRCSYCHSPYFVPTWSGKIDGIIKWGSQYYVVDHKTSSRLGWTYFAQFRPSVQMTGYVWAAQQMIGKPISGVVINAIGVYKSKMHFERDISSREPWEVDEFVEEAIYRIEEIRKRDVHNLKEWHPNWTSCGDWGGCRFRDLCLTHEPERLVPLMFDVEIWSPLEGK